MGKHFSQLPVSDLIPYLSELSELGRDCIAGFSVYLKAPWTELSCNDRTKLTEFFLDALVWDENHPKCLSILILIFSRRSDLEDEQKRIVVKKLEQIYEEFQPSDIDWMSIPPHTYYEYANITLLEYAFDLSSEDECASAAFDALASALENEPNWQLIRSTIAAIGNRIDNPGPNGREIDRMLDLILSNERWYDAVTAELLFRCYHQKRIREELIDGERILHLLSSLPADEKICENIRTGVGYLAAHVSQDRGWNNEVLDNFISILLENMDSWILNGYLYILFGSKNIPEMKPVSVFLKKLSELNNLNDFLSGVSFPLLFNLFCRLPADDSIWKIADECCKIRKIYAYDEVLKFFETSDCELYGKKILEDLSQMIRNEIVFSKKDIGRIVAIANNIRGEEYEIGKDKVRNALYNIEEYEAGKQIR